MLTSEEHTAFLNHKHMLIDYIEYVEDCVANNDMPLIFKEWDENAENEPQSGRIKMKRVAELKTETLHTR